MHRQSIAARLSGDDDPAAPVANVDPAHENWPKKSSRSNIVRLIAWVPTVREGRIGAAWPA
jgi:hypothetical protein